MNSPSVHMGAVRVAAQLPVPEWRVASAQKLSWAALRGSAGFPGTHACARTWPTACGDSSRRRRGFSAPFRRRRARTRRRPPERQQHPRRSQITLFHRAKSLHSSCWAVRDTVSRSFQVTVADSLRTRAIVFTLSCCAASHSARNAGAPGALNGGMATPNRPQPSS